MNEVSDTTAGRWSADVGRKLVAALPAITTGDVCRALLVLLVISGVYDKSGVHVWLSGHAVSISPYKILILILGSLVLVGLFGRWTEIGDAFDSRLWRLLVAFVVVQTLASLAGLIVAPGGFALSSEAYYLIQRGQVIFIPLVALRYGVTPRQLLKLFVAAVLLHLAFVGLQFADTGAYRAFAASVADPLRLDVTSSWNGHMLDYIGLQRTGNYGAFVAAFGLLALAFSPRRPALRVLQLLIVGASVWISLTSNSRAVLLMTVVALLVFAVKQRLLHRHRDYFWIGALGLVGLALLLAVAPRIAVFRSAYAFVSPAKLASNEGKLTIARYGMELFAESPIVGFGQRPFAEISRRVGNRLGSQAYTHSYMLSTLLGTGLVGLIMYLLVFVAITRRLWQGRGRVFAIMCGVYVGLGVYNIVYDAGALDLFALYNGLAAYVALTMGGPLDPAGALPSSCERHDPGPPGRTTQASCPEPS